MSLAGTLGRAVLVQTGARNGHGPDLSGYDLASGDLMWRVGGTLLGQGHGQALLLSPGVGDPPQPQTPQAIALTRVGGTYREADQATPLLLSVPGRQGCGGVKYQRNYPDLSFTGRFLYALRRDGCGKFIARFDWHAAEPRPPLIYPDRRPPVPLPRVLVPLPPGRP